MFPRDLELRHGPDNGFRRRSKASMSASEIHAGSETRITANCLLHRTGRTSFLRLSPQQRAGLSGNEPSSIKSPRARYHARFDRGKVHQAQETHFKKAAECKQGVSLPVQKRPIPVGLDEDANIVAPRPQGWSGHETNSAR